MINIYKYAKHLDGDVANITEPPGTAVPAMKLWTFWQCWVVVTSLSQSWTRSGIILEAAQSQFQPSKGSSLTAVVSMARNEKEIQ